MSHDRQMRFYKAYAAFSSAAIAVLVFTGFQAQSSKHQKFDEIDVQRINVHEPDGKLSLVVSSKARLPEPIVDGKVGRRDGPSPGMIFYNSRGDEDGGLVFSGDQQGEKYDASAGLFFDQYRQDQTVGLLYEDQNGKRTAGLAVWDRPDTSMASFMEKMEAMKGMPEPERKKVRAEMKERGEFGAVRLFVGKEPSRASVLVMSDAMGKPRLRISVNADGNPSLTFMDEQGKMTYSLPPTAK
jgi:hypothetical protein